jgi:transcriptional regulator with XRE-family HTH domain
MTQTALARQAGVSRSLVKMVERQGHQPSAIKAHAIADALGVDLDDFSTPTDSAAAA